VGKYSGAQYEEHTSQQAHSPAVEVPFTEKIKEYSA